MQNGDTKHTSGWLPWNFPKQNKSHNNFRRAIHLDGFFFEATDLNFIRIFAAISNFMGRIIGIDYGKKRIGLAVTDPLQMFASPLETVKPQEFERFIENYLSTEEVDEFVIGYPVQLNNLPSESVKYIDPFLKKMKKLFPGITVHLVDERFTSSLAFQTMIEGGVKMKDRRDKSMVDRISASIILQSFLNKRSNKK